MKGCRPVNYNRKETSCNVCGKVFFQNQSSNKKYCSRKCFGISQRGKRAWNKGMKFPEWRGQNNTNWRGGCNQLERSRFKNEFQKKVFERDNYTCQLCGKRGGYLQVDHIQPWAEYVEGRFDINNLRTLCMDCHYFVTFGKKKPKNILWGHHPRKGSDKYEII